MSYLNNDPKKKIGWEEEAGKTKGGSVTKDVSDMEKITEDEGVVKYDEELPDKRDM